MARVTGIGGIFFKASDSNGLRDWYRDKLGIKTTPYGATFGWRPVDSPDSLANTLWSTFPDTTKYFEPSGKSFMINYRVDNVEELVTQLRALGVEVVGDVQNSDYGKFAHVLDPEGNKVELWEPVDSPFTPDGAAETNH